MWEIIALGKNILEEYETGQQVAVIPYVACQQCPARAKVGAPTVVKDLGDWCPSGRRIQ